MEHSSKPLFKFFSSIFFVLLLFCLSRQVPLNQYPSILTFVFLIYLVLLFFSDKLVVKINKRVTIVVLLFYAGLLFWAIFKNNEPIFIFRFFFIVFLLNFVLFLDVSDGRYALSLKYIYLIQALLVVCLGILMPIYFSLDTYAPIRHLVKGNNWGDIYSYNGVFFRIQLLGNALLPFLFFVLYDRFRKGSNEIFSLLLTMLAVFFAGNLTFFISIFIYAVLYELVIIKRFSLNVSKYKFYFFGVLLLLAPVVTLYIIDLIIMKSTGSVSSIGTRIDQFHVLINDLSSNISTVLFGNGLGHTVSVSTEHRDYTGRVYFELQFFYLLNQLGLFGMLIFLTTHFFLFFKRIKDKVYILMYVCYWVYAFTNPYMFDTTHIVVLLILMSMSTEKLNNKYTSLS